MANQEPRNQLTRQSSVLPNWKLVSDKWPDNVKKSNCYNVQSPTDFSCAGRKGEGRWIADEVFRRYSLGIHNWNHNGVRATSDKQKMFRTFFFIFNVLLTARRDISVQ